ncbi:MAG TPA: response regulator transcription factor [Chitinophagaceae bacterium]|nr:response regulator transcription factor [Chitinophagaceae bacterium]
MILIVDDNKKFIDRVVALLREYGSKKNIIAAGDYGEAVKLIAKEKPVIVLLDINMPGKSGIEVLRYIKGEGWYCKVIMVSNHSNESYRKLCFEAGADHFLDKSREFGKIPELIEEMTR